MQIIKKVLRKRYVVPVLLAVAVIFTLEATNTTHFFHKSAVVRAPSAPITNLDNSQSKSAADETKTPSTNHGVRKGTATDKQGQVPSNVPTDPSLWSKSKSSAITVKLPGANGKLVSGGTLTGAASVGQVQYRLIDDEVGVVSQGAVSVVDGNFTASIDFTAYSNTGRLDVFSTEAGGKEINGVQVPVKF